MKYLATFYCNIWPHWDRPTKVLQFYRDQSRLAGDVDEVKLDLNDLVRRRDDVQAAGLDVVQALGVVDVVAGIVHRLNAFCWSKLKTIVLENFCRRRPFGNSDNLKCTVQLTDPVPCVLYLCISFYNYINKRPTYPHSLDLYDLDLYRL